jgi:hypothetical protein
MTAKIREERECLAGIAALFLLLLPGVPSQRIPSAAEALDPSRQLMGAETSGLRDEAHLLSVGAQDSERSGFTELKGSIGRLHAEGANEDSSTLNGEKHP